MVPPTAGKFKKKHPKIAQKTTGFPDLPIFVDWWSCLFLAQGFHHSCYSWIGSNLWCALAFRKSISLYTVYGCTVCIHKHIHMKYCIYLHMHLRVSMVFIYGMYIVPYVYTPMISYAFFFLTCTYSPAKHYGRGKETLVFVPAFCQPAWLLGQKRNRWAAEWLGPAGTILGESFRIMNPRSKRIMKIMTVLKWCLKWCCERGLRCQWVFCASSFGALCWESSGYSSASLAWSLIQCLLSVCPSPLTSWGDLGKSWMELFNTRSFDTWAELLTSRKLIFFGRASLIGHVAKRTAHLEL